MRAELRYFQGSQIMMQFLQKLILDLKGTVRLRERFPFIRKLIGKELLAKLSPQINNYIQEHADSESTNSLWNKFKSDLHAAIEKHVLHKCCSSHNRPPWISAKIRNLLRSRDRLYLKSKRARKNNKESIKNKLCSLKHKIRRETRAIRIMWKPTSFLKHQMSQIEVIKNCGPSSNAERQTQSV